MTYTMPCLRGIVSCSHTFHTAIFKNHADFDERSFNNTVRSALMENTFAGKIHQENQDLLEGHTYLNQDIMRFKMIYTYSNYVLPVLQEANNAAVRNGRSFAKNSLILAAIISMISLLIFRF